MENQKASYEMNNSPPGMFPNIQKQGPFLGFNSQKYQFQQSNMGQKESESPMGGTSPHGANLKPTNSFA